MNANQLKAIWLGLTMVGFGIMSVLLVVPGTQAQGPSPPTATPNSPLPANPGGGAGQDSNADDDDDNSSLPAGACIEVHRWVILSAPGGSLVAGTEPFTLPQFPNETVRVEAVLW